MAKKNRVEPCIFCGQLACRCGKPEPKAKVSRSIKPKTDPPKEREAFDPTETAPAKPHFKIEAEVEYDLNTINALRVVREIVCAEDQREIDKIINKPLTPALDKRVAEWRQRHVR